MTSFVIEGANEKKQIEEAMKICQDAGIDSLDITVFSPERSADSESPTKTDVSIGVSDIKLLKQKLFLKPLRGEMKALIMQNAESLTIPAQNALLKVLEEPPNNTLIILTTERKDILLKTILSRCKIISISSSPKVLLDDDKKAFEILTRKLPEHSIGESLRLAQDLSKNKQHAIEWLEKAILVARTLLIKTLSQKDTYRNGALVSLLRKLTDTYTILKTTNANARLQLETMFLTLRNNTQT